MNNIGLNFNYGKQEISQKGVNKASQETVEKKDVSSDEVYKPENPELPKPQTKAKFRGRAGESFKDIKNRYREAGVFCFEEGDQILEFDKDGKLIARYIYDGEGHWRAEI